MMVRLSSKNITKKSETKLAEAFKASFTVLRNLPEVKRFLEDLLTQSEDLMLSKRLATAVLLTKGHDYRSIAKILKISTTTVLSVSKKLRSEGGGYRTAVGRILRQDNLGKIFLELEKTPVRRKK